MVQPGQEQIMKVEVDSNEYLEKLVEHSFMKIYAIANVKETKQTWSEEDDFTFIMPAVTIMVAGICRVGETCEVAFRYL